MTQLIWNGNEYEIARDCDSAEIPEWPVSDSEGHWNYREFRGQRVVFRQQNVYFGFRAKLVSKIPEDTEGLYRTSSGDFYRAI